MDSLRGRGMAILAGGITAALAVVAVVLLTGDDGDTEQASSVVPTAPAEEAGKAPEGGAGPTPEAGAKKAPSEAPVGASDGDSKLTREEVEKQLKVVPLEQRRQFAQTAVLGVLRTYGYTTATVTLKKKGRVVAALIPPADACAAEAAKIPEIRKKLFDVILFARKVRLQVLGSGDLAAYVSANCKPLKPPVAPGRLLWSASGTGLQSSEQFQVTADRFTVSYANNSGNLEIYVVRGQQLIEPVIKSETREAGSQTYPGPGTFRVTVTGSGSWEVAVYDGA